MILSVSQMQQLEQSAFLRGVKPADLMKEAGYGIARVVQQFFPQSGTCIVYCGKGHNAGDALVAARYLAKRGWKILVRLAFSKEELAPLTRLQLEKIANKIQRSKKKRNSDIKDDSFFPYSKPDPICYPLVQLDGLLGIGACGVPTGMVAALCEEMNQVRHKQAAFTVAVDIPSGLDGTTGLLEGACVQADVTVTIGFVKTGLVADAATNHVGRLVVVPLLELSAEKKIFPNGGSTNEVSTNGVNGNGVLISTKANDGINEDILVCPNSNTDPVCDPICDMEVALPEKLRLLLPPRDFDVHKGIFGRVGIMAGSRGYLGAARLASQAALHAGGGLITLYALQENYELLARSCAPEVMVKPIKRWSDLLFEKLDALAIGPGLGSARREEILEIVEQAPWPCVLDADALNAVAKHRNLLLKCNGPRLLTPHPGEMRRLFPAEGRDRKTWATDFTNHYPVTLLLKGSRTIVAEREKPISFNTTGNPGMASGGMGDVLSGVLASFLARGIIPRDAAVLGAWLCGRAAEIAVYNGTASEESLVASDVIDHLGSAMKGLRQGSY
ncbi:MAG: NAD(P)H-hydrate dehydratase [Chthoniobacterales bacterium]